MPMGNGESTTGSDNAANIGFAFQRLVRELATQQMPDIAFYFPFRDQWRADILVEGSRMVVRIEDQLIPGIPQAGSFDANEALKAKASELLKGDGTAGELADPDWRSQTVFSYVGPLIRGAEGWPAFAAAAVDWLNSVVIPEVVELNRSRVLRAIPPPPNYLPTELLAATCVIDDGAAKQGTAFALEGGGMVTCAHVLSDASFAYRPRDARQALSHSGDQTESNR